LAFRSTFRNFASSMGKIQHRFKQFKEWKQQPHRVAPIPEEEHVCPTCETHYYGNYCPRCGQSCKIARYSFKNALMLYLDVWGLGNRGMFRSIRDLVLRPGYMTRDYLRGMQMAYFPPFKMFFLLCTLSILVDSGMNIQGINRPGVNDSEYKRIIASGLLSTGEGLNEFGEKMEKEAEAQNKNKKKTEKYNELEKKIDKASDDSSKLIHIIYQSAWDFGKSHTSILVLILLMLYTWPLWLLIRHCPAIPDFRFSECFVAIIYIINMLIVYNIIPSLLCFSPKVEMEYNLLTLLLVFIPIKQLSGYSYLNTIWRVVFAVISFVLMLILLFLGTFILVYIYCLIANGFFSS